MNISDDFEQLLAQFMSARGITKKSEAIRIAITEGLARARKTRREKDFSTWVGLGNKTPSNRRRRFRSDDDLWK